MSRSPDKSWKEFEDAVFRIHQAFNVGATVERDVRLKGVDSKTNRQIDVSIRQQIGVSHILIVVECKKWGRPVDLPEVSSFVGTVRDVRATTGMMISQEGFTESAAEFAQTYGVALYTFRDLESDSWPNDLPTPIVMKIWEARIRDFRDPLTWKELSPEDAVFFDESHKQIDAADWIGKEATAGRIPIVGKDVFFNFYDRSDPPRHFALRLDARVREFRLIGKLHFEGLISTDGGRIEARQVELVADSVPDEILCEGRPESDEPSGSPMRLKLQSADITPFGVPPFGIGRVMLRMTLASLKPIGIDLRSCSTQKR